MNSKGDAKTILFHPLNAPGHINPMVALADILKYEHGHRCIFLIYGEMIGNTLAEHGHELIKLEDTSQVEFYELKNSDDPIKNDLEAEARGEKKRKFSGFEIWPQIVARKSAIFKLPPIEAYLQTMNSLPSVMVNLIRSSHAEIEQCIFERIKPDLIIIDGYIIPPCILKKADVIPWVRLYSANPMFLTKSRFPDGVKPVPTCGFQLKTKAERANDPANFRAMIDEWSNAQQMVASAMQKEPNIIADLFKDFDCAPPPPGKLTHESQHLNLHTYPRRLDYDQDDDLFEYEDREFPVDSLIRLPFGRMISEKVISDWESKFEQAKARVGQQCEVVFLSMGSIASGQVSLMKRLVNLVGQDTKRLYVISKGSNGKLFELGDNMIGDNFVPQTFFLERCQLAVVHGGNNTITECCFYGKPMIVLPVFSDQLDNAQRVDDLGLGKRLSLWDADRLTSDLVPTIDKLLADEQCLARCAQIGQEMRTRDEPRKTAFMLDKLAKEHHLDQDFIDLCRDRDLAEIQAKLISNNNKHDQQETSV